MFFNKMLFFFSKIVVVFLKCFPLIRTKKDIARPRKINETRINVGNILFKIDA